MLHTMVFYQLQTPLENLITFKTFMSLDAPKEFATANATLHVTDNDLY